MVTEIVDTPETVKSVEPGDTGHTQVSPGGEEGPGKQGEAP